MQGDEEEEEGSHGVDCFGLPDQVVAVLPSDPFELLDVARKITSIALATRLSKFEAESVELRRELAEREDLVYNLSGRVSDLEAKLADADEKLARAEEERESLLSENGTLSNTVKKLNRDVSKLEVFKKTLMQSLQEEDENPQAGASQSAANPLRNVNYLSKQLNADSQKFNSINTSDLHLIKTPSEQPQLSESGSLLSEDRSSIEKAVETSKPLKVARRGGSDRKITPPDSPTRHHSTSVSPTRRQSISFPMARGVFDDRSATMSSTNSSHSSLSGTLEPGSPQAARNKVDGKEFFRQVRARLSYEHFGTFLANVKDMNSHKQTKEETLRKAEEIFGPDNNDLYIIFEGLINRNQQ